MQSVLDKPDYSFGQTPYVILFYNDSNIHERSQI